MQNIISELRQIKVAIGFSRITDHTNAGFFIVSAAREFKDEEKGIRFSPKELVERSEQLKAMIRSHGLGYVPMTGAYTERGDGDLAGKTSMESSFLVPLKGKDADWGKDIAQKLGRHFDQQTVLFCYPGEVTPKYVLLWKDGHESNLGDGLHFDQTMIEDWSALNKGSHAGRPFKLL